MSPKSHRSAAFATLLLGGLLAVQAVSRHAYAQNWTAPAWVMSESQAAEYESKEFRPARDSLKTGSPNGGQVKQAQQFADYYLSKLTHSDRADLPQSVVESFIRDLNLNASSVQRTNAMDEVIAKAPELMTHPDSIVPYNTVLFVSSLTTSAGALNSAAAPYPGGLNFLASVVANPDYKNDSRILAAAGIANIFRDGQNVSTVEKANAATALAQTLQQTPPSPEVEVYWFRRRMIHALGYADRLDSLSGEPVVITTLVSIINDPDEVLINRAEAALSTSRLPMTGSVNVPLITHEMMKLMLELTDGLAASPRSEGSVAVHWREAIMRVYFAFRPENPEGARNHQGLLYQVERGGLSGARNTVTSAFDAAFPVMKAVIETLNPSAATVSPEARDAIQKWITENPPENRSVMPGATPLPQERQHRAVKQPAEEAAPSDEEETEETPMPEGASTESGSSAATPTANRTLTGSRLVG